MSRWYAAHVVMYVKRKDGRPGKTTLWENIVLLKASSAAEAFEKAQQRGRDDEGDDDGTFRWGGEPAQWVFAGVRKVTECEDPEKRPGDGSEVSYTEWELESEDAVWKLLQGKAVKARLTDRFADFEGTAESVSRPA
jgi:hypothetical protein